MATSLPLHLLDSNAHSEVSEPEKPQSCEGDKFSRKTVPGNASLVFSYAM